MSGRRRKPQGWLDQSRNIGWLGWGSCLQQVRRGNLSSQGQAPDSGFVLEKEFVNVVVKGEE
jgi:hypothetical protein